MTQSILSETPVDASTVKRWTDDSIKDLTYRVVETRADLEELWAEIRAKKKVACDIEARSTDPYTATYTRPGFPVVSIQFSTGPRTAWFLPISHFDFLADDNPHGLFWQSDSIYLYDFLKDIFENKEYFIIGHNFKFDSKFIAQYFGIKPKLDFDTMLGFGLFQDTSNGLKKLAWQYSDLGGYEAEQDRYTHTLPVSEQYDMFYYPMDNLVLYGCADVDVTYRLFNVLNEKLTTDPQMLKLFTILTRASKAFLDIEHEGIKINKSYLNQLEIDIKLEMSAVEAEFYQMAYNEIQEMEADMIKAATSLKTGKILKTKIIKFNIASNDHIGVLFFEKLKIPTNPKFVSAKTKKHSVGKAVLQALKSDYPIAAKLLVHRTLAKQLSSFVESYPKFIDVNDRIHPDYKLIRYYNETEEKEQGTVTGRLSCQNPNLQQVPSRGDGKRIKKLFIPDYDNHWLVDCLAPSTRLLTSNFVWKKIEDIKIGEELVGFSEKLGKNTVLEKSVVEMTTKRTAPRYKITTDKGEIICSNNHLWPVYKRIYKNGIRTSRNWIKAEDLQVGQEISYLRTPWTTDNTFEDGWLSGLLDGEGWCGKRGGSGIAQNNGKTLNRIIEKLKHDKIEYKEYSRPSYGNCVHLEFSGSWASMLILGKYQPKRLLEKYEWEGRRSWNKNSSPAKILAVEFIGEGEVVSVKTSSKTFFAEGFFSHNCDYAGIELRVMAMHCQDENMRNFFAAGKGDFHRFVAAKIHKTKEDAITDAQRAVAKTTVFAVLYGAGPSKISDTTGMSYKDAQKFIEDYFRLFPALKGWINKQKVFAQKHLFVKSLFGRVRNLPEANSNNTYLMERSLRQAVNSVVQSDASDLTLYSLIRIHKYLNSFKNYDINRPTRLRGSVHDSILLSVHDRNLDEIIEHVKVNILENPTLDFIKKCGILLKADVSVGKNWGEQEKLVYE